LTQFLNIQLFVSELFFDFQDFEHSLKKYRIKDVTNMIINNGTELKSFKGFLKLTASINHVTALDNPIVNPYKDTIVLDKTYLTLDSVFFSETVPKPMYFVEIKLSDNLNIRARSVYTIIEFISEISGFADIFFVLFGFLVGQCYTPLSAQAHTMRNLALISPRLKRPKSKNRLEQLSFAYFGRFYLSLSMWHFLML
jgi:hypothetical protein